MKKDKNLSLKSNENKVTENLEVILTSSGLALTAAGTTNPVLGLIGVALSIASLPFAAHNASLIRKQLKQIIDAFNDLNTRLENLENINENQSTILFLNEYKFFDYALKEKTKEKIQAYAKVFSEGINDKTILEESDLFDIQMDIINSLRMEDIVLLNQIFTFIEKEKQMPYLSEFTKEEIEAFIITNTPEEETLNEYALRHLVNLGLVKERFDAVIPNTVGDNHILSGDTAFYYSLTQRCKMIRDIIVK